jgi:hypothetical protein
MRASGGRAGAGGAARPGGPARTDASLGELRMRTRTALLGLEDRDLAMQAQWGVQGLVRACSPRNPAAHASLPPAPTSGLRKPAACSNHRPVHTSGAQT